MNKPVVAVDFDDSLVVFGEVLFAYLNQRFSTRVAFTDARTFDLTKTFGQDHDTMVRQVRHFCHQRHHEIMPADGVHKVLARLADHYEFRLVTSRCESLREITEAWMEEQGLLHHFPVREFTCGYGSLFPHLTRSKLEVCREMGARVLIEDAPHNAQAVANEIPVLMPHRPWNDMFGHPNVTRVHSWLEIEHELLEFIGA